MDHGRPPFSLRQLAYFAAVADHGSYRRAAEVLNMSQPPLSQQMQLLEQQIGAALFDRSTRRVRLTLAGEELLNQSRHLLSSAGTLGSRIRAIDRGEAGALRVGITEEQLGGASFARIVQFVGEHPSVSVEIIVAYSLDLVRQLENWDLDLALCNAPVRTNDAASVRWPLPASAIVAVVGVSSFLEAEELDIQPLLSATLIVAPPTCLAPFSIRCRNLLDALGIEPVRCIYTSSNAAAVQMTAAGVGVCLISENSTRSLPATCRTVRLENPLASTDHVLLTPRRQASPAVDQLVARLTVASHPSRN